MSTDDVESRTLAEAFTAVSFGDEDLGWVPHALDGVRAYLQRWGAGPEGDPFVRSVDGEVEAGYRATTPVGGEGDVEPSDLPGGTVAVTVVESGGSEDALTAVRDWITAKGASPRGQHWEVLLDGHPDGRREVVQPYA